jgi:chaperonin cofactor prefoldin
LSSTIDIACEALNNLADAIVSSSSEDRNLKEIYGWNFSALTRHDLANIPRSLAFKLKNVDIESLSAERIADLQTLPARLQSLRSDTVPYMFNGNGSSAVPAFLGLMSWLSELCSTVPDWQQLADNKALPTALIRRLRSIQAELDTLVTDKDNVEKQIKIINDATEAAESLPTDLKALREARATMNQLNVDSAKEFALISERHSESNRLAEQIRALDSEAKQLVSNCEEAYRITTTKGLAAAFDARATSLSRSVVFWVVGLLAALSAGSLIGSVRLSILTELITQSSSNWSLIWLNIVLSIFSIGAPLWFAWLATKQIGQRFRLAEDYAFKASVAKAYEGYRKEAARLDVNLEHRLFSSALARLEEAPLRLIENVNHGSPWHEALSSPIIKDTANNVAETAKQMIAKAGLNDKQ